MGKLIDADELKDVVEYMCDEDGSKEAQKWCEWFVRVIQAQENKKDEREKGGDTIVSSVSERKKMGMSIDKTIEFFNGLECHTPQAKDARDVAIETMRKYQKVEDIYYHQSGETLENSLRAVIEDGEID